MEDQNEHSMTDMTGMTDTETDRLAELEEIITKNFQGFYAVGCALAEISASKLYRLTHNTFEVYCRERFEVARRTAYQYIEAKDVMDNVRHGAQTKLLPQNERQLRPLTKLTPEDQVEAWEKAVKSAPFEGGITAKHVSQVVGDMLGEMLKKRTETLKGKTNNIHTRFCLHFFHDSIYVRTVVQKTGSYMNCINSLSKGSHPCFQHNQPKNR